MSMLRKALCSTVDFVNHVLESLTEEGKAFHEIEHVIYVRMADMGDLAKATSKEHQVQWQLKIAKSDDNFGTGSIRIRKTIPNIVNHNLAEYTLTTKVKSKDGSIEVEVPTTEDNFKQFALLSPEGMTKDRYSFNIPGTDMVWEVDMFYLPGAEIGSGKYHAWCKIDLEVRERLETLPELPIRALEVISAPYGSRTEAEEKIVTSLYDNEFITKNLFVQR